MLHRKRNIFTSILLLLISNMYFSSFAENIHSDHAILINICFIPLCLGFIGGFILKGSYFERLIFIVPIPIFSIILTEGDAAKPGLEMILIGPLLLFFIFGLSMAYFIYKTITRLKGDELNERKAK